MPPGIQDTNSARHYAVFLSYRHADNKEQGRQWATWLHQSLEGYEIPAAGSVELKPGGAHLMLVNIKAPLKEGTKVPLTLRFERAGEVRTELHVGRLDASARPH